jgi:DNA-binding MarR family transcriptional regulator
MSGHPTVSGDQLPQVDEIRAVLCAVHSELSLQHVIALLTVALTPGLSVTELAERMGVPQQSASRYVALLSGRYELEGAEVTPLLDQAISRTDPRKRALFLTEAGLTRVMQLIEARERTGKGR